MYENRLTVIGRHEATDWPNAMQGQHAELLETRSSRLRYQFETKQSPLPALRRLARVNPGLIFVLSYETTRCWGLARAQARSLIHHRV